MRFRPWRHNSLILQTLQHVLKINIPLKSWRLFFWGWFSGKFCGYGRRGARYIKRIFGVQRPNMWLKKPLPSFSAKVWEDFQRAK